MTDDDLNSLFAAARAAGPAPSEALIARVMADALAHQPAPRPAPDPVPGAAAAVRRRPVWARLADVFGGTGALAGMGSAAVAGLFLGLVPPEGLLALSDSVLFDTALGGTLDSVALMPSIDGLFAEVTP